MGGAGSGGFGFVIDSGTLVVIAVVAIALMILAAWMMFGR